MKKILKEIIKLLDVIKTDDLHYKWNRRKNLYFYWIFFTYCFLRDLHKGYLSIKYADDEQSKVANEWKNIYKGIKSIEKKLFLINTGL